MKHMNLLPKLKQQELAHERAFYGVAVAAAIATMILIIGALVQVGVGVYLDRSSKDIDAKIEQLKRVSNKTENAEIKLRIRAMNAQIEDFNNLAVATPQWSGVLDAFIKNVPAGVRITQFDAQTDTKQVTINGFSPSRDLVIDLYNNINADKTHFVNIDYPLENVTQPVNVRFHFTFTIADGVLVKGVQP